MSIPGRILQPRAQSTSREAPAVPPRKETFQDFVVTKLTEMHNHMQMSNQELAVNLPGLMRQIVQEELGSVLPTLQQLNDRGTDQGVQTALAKEQITELAARNTVLESQIKKQEKTLESLRADLNKKTKEARKLHEIIIQSGQDGSVVADEDIEKKFSELSYGILHIVNKHFSGVESCTRPKQLVGLSNDDKILWLRSSIANAMYSNFFRPSVRLFGLDKRREEAQVELESKLIEREVPLSDVAEWRIKTVQVCRAMQLKKRFAYPTSLSDALSQELEDCCTARDKDGRRASLEEMDNLCIKAFELSLTLRESKAKFVWGQGEAPDTIPQSVVELIGPYNMRSGTGQAKPVHVLFGPVWKDTDGERMLLRKGEILNGRLSA